MVTQFEQYIKLNKKFPPEVLTSVKQDKNPGKLADTIASHLAVKILEKQELLELENILARLEKVYAHMEGEIGVLQVKSVSRIGLKHQMEKLSVNTISMSK